MSETPESNTDTETRGHMSLLARGAAIGSAGVLLTLFFVYLGFPYDLLAQNLSRQIETRANATIVYESVGPRATLLGPGVGFEDLAWIPADGKAMELGDVTLRPAWSLSWFTGSPAIHVATTTPLLELDMAVWISDPMRVEGSLEEVDLSQVSGAGSLDRANLNGEFTMDFDLTLPQNGTWEGTARFEAFDGDFTPPDIGLPIPYERFEGVARLPGDGFLHIESAEIEAPSLLISSQGRIQWQPGRNVRALDLVAGIDASDPTVRANLIKAGIRLDREGKGKLKIGGTLAKPTFD